ncbi:hypothetical protein [Streptomyces sp. YGL11-2]|uniref:hypothetical protein n=1 Tax=Streptomyces sp. YGL11-2 TaxID=3414028 RepID=UPI003CF5CD68
MTTPFPGGRGTGVPSRGASAPGDPGAPGAPARTVPARTSSARTVAACTAPVYPAPAAAAVRRTTEAAPCDAGAAAHDVEAAPRDAEAALRDAEAVPRDAVAVRRGAGTIPPDDDADGPDADGPDAADPRRWLILAIASAAQFLAVLDLIAVTIAFPAIGQDFAPAPASALSWVLNGYTVVLAALLVPAGGAAS